MCSYRLWYFQTKRNGLLLINTKADNLFITTNKKDVR
jgi:hypothetical protein